MKVLLDGRPAFSLEAEVAMKAGLRVGQELSVDEVAAIARADCLQRCLGAAVHYLGYRPRSESELRERLKRRGFDDGDIEAVVTKLKGKGLVDDLAFAEFWKDNRQTFSPRSRWLTSAELKRKGISSDIIDRVVEDVDDSDSARRVALSRAHNLPRTEYAAFYRRLGGYLKRRGFGYAVINSVVKTTWDEIGGKVKDGVFSDIESGK